MSPNINQKERGFSLVEILVVSFIFLAIIASSTAIYISSSKSQRYLLDTQQLIDQMSYAMEYISRSARMAAKDDLQNCLGQDGCIVSSSGLNYCTNSNSNVLTFKNYKDQCQSFSIKDGRIYQNLKDLNGNPINYLDDLPLTSARFDIGNFKIIISGDDTGDNLQPRVTLYLEMSPQERDLRAPIKMQTTISQRNLDK